MLAVEPPVCAWTSWWTAGAWLKLVNNSVQDITASPHAFELQLPPGRSGAVEVRRSIDLAPLHLENCLAAEA
jgi:hypothetical protein